MQISNNSPHLLTSLFIGMHCCYIATSINYVMYNIAYPKINRLHDISGEFDTHPVQAWPKTHRPTARCLLQCLQVASVTSMTSIEMAPLV